MKKEKKITNTKNLVLIFFVVFALIFLIIYGIFLISHSQIGISSEDEYFMKLAFQEAALALENGEYPVGAVIVVNGSVISKAHNEEVSSNRTFAHAEMLAIDKALRTLDIHDFGKLKTSDITLYTTYEPCTMDEGFIILKKVPRVVVGKRKSFTKMLKDISSRLKYRLKERGGLYEYFHDDLQKARYNS